MTELLNQKQIWLLYYENPLLKRFGREFFRQIPTFPGVYWMLDEHKNILYVGKAKNLKNRLQSYKRIKPDQSSRKLLRMIQLVREIQWEECESEPAALLRENLLLRTHRPHFNTLNTHPEGYYFLGFDVSRCHLSFGLTTSPEVSFQCKYGAFKGRGLIRRGYAALLRLLWGALAEQDQERYEYPGVLVRKRVPYSYALHLREDVSLSEKQEWVQLIQRFLKGTSRALLEKLSMELLVRPNIPPFYYHLIQEDLEILQDFYQYGPQRNKRLRVFHKMKEPILAQDQIDDLLVTYHFGKRFA